MNWISTKKVLPIEDKQVLLLVNQEAIEGCYNKDRKYDDWNFVTMHVHGCGCCSSGGDEVTHWMELPKLPSK